MAERRMFTKKVTDDDNFMQLSSSAQALYLHLSMSADDDGFCNQVSICMFKAHASIQDLEALFKKRYIYQFENGVIVIKHWRMANALRKDRYTPTAFQEELAQLQIKDNGSYTMSDKSLPSMGDLADVGIDHEETARQIAYKESALPYSFDYKIRQAFYGKRCPICGNEMRKYVDEDGVVAENRLPTIQHNVPVSKGGKHELGNISVICHQCNVTIQDEVTGSLNAEEVVAEWEKISGCRLVAACLPQDRLGKDSKEKVSKDLEKRKRFKPPTLEEVEAYASERKSTVDPKAFFEYYDAGHWIDSEGKPVKNWKQKFLTWEKREKTKPYNRKVQTAAEYEDDRKKNPQKVNVDDLHHILDTI